MVDKRNPNYDLSLSRKIDEADLLRRATALIAPTRANKEACKLEIKQAVLAIRLLPASLSTDGYLSAKEIREKAAAARTAAAQLQKSLASLPPLILGTLFGDFDSAMRFYQQVGQLKNALSDLRREAQAGVSKGGPRSDFFKSLAAATAFTILKKFSQKPPTKTTTGPYYELASVFYEAATGIAGANLDRICRRTSDRLRELDSNILQIVPSQLMSDELLALLPNVFGIQSDQ